MNKGRIWIVNNFGTLVGSLFRNLPNCLFSYGKDFLFKLLQNLIPDLIILEFPEFISRRQRFTSAPCIR